MHGCFSTHTYTHTNTHINTHTRTLARAHTHIQTHTRTHIPTHDNIKRGGKKLKKRPLLWLHEIRAHHDIKVGLPYFQNAHEVHRLLPCTPISFAPLSIPLVCRGYRCICMHICESQHTRLHIHAQAHAHICTRMHAHACFHRHTHKRTRTHAQTHTYTHTCISVDIRIYINTHILPQTPHKKSYVHLYMRGER